MRLYLLYVVLIYGGDVEEQDAEHVVEVFGVGVWGFFVMLLFL